MRACVWQMCLELSAWPSLSISPDRAINCSAVPTEHVLENCEPSGSPVRRSVLLLFSLDSLHPPMPSFLFFISLQPIKVILLELRSLLHLFQTSYPSLSQPLLGSQPTVLDTTMHDPASTSAALPAVMFSSYITSML